MIYGRHSSEASKALSVVDHSDFIVSDDSMKRLHETVDLWVVSGRSFVVVPKFLKKTSTGFHPSEDVPHIFL